MGRHSNTVQALPFYQHLFQRKHWVFLNIEYCMKC